MQEQLQSLSVLDWITTLTALIYVFLAARNNPWCWVFGAVSCSIWAYLDVFAYDLYSDALLQIFYVVMSGIGLYQWRYGGERDAPLPVTKMTLAEHGYMLAGSFIGGTALGYFVSQNVAAAATYPDAITTAASVGATILLLRRRIENWLYWVVIDLAYVFIFWSRGATLFTAIMLIYIVVAIYGYLQWQKELIIKTESK